MSAAPPGRDPTTVARVRRRTQGWFFWGVFFGWNSAWFVTGRKKHRGMVTADVCTPPRSGFMNVTVLMGEGSKPAPVTMGFLTSP